MRLGLAAPAKINLYLHVLGRREDGYHRLDSLVAFTDLHDDLEVETYDRLALTVSGDLGAGLAGQDPETNLVVRAARALADVAGIKPGARVRLDKRIPVAAGLGGGSADAAAALRLLDRLWGLGLDRRALAAIGLRLGADVPMCLDGRPRRVGGVGDRLYGVRALPSVPLVLVNSGAELSTRDVFRAHDLPFSAPARALPTAPDPAVLARQLSRRRNDLTTAAASRVATIVDVLAALNVAGALLARMSGSGATCFGIFPTSDTALRGAAYLADAWPAWWVRTTSLRALPPEIRPVA